MAGGAKRAGGGEGGRVVDRGDDRWRAGDVDRRCAPSVVRPVVPGDEHGRERGGGGVAAGWRSRGQRGRIAAVGHVTLDAGQAKWAPPRPIGRISAGSSIKVGGAD
ncbi:hypothetical protein GCM10018962_34630 [Dactylosporangium matsuzakiense]|uniref:Uncharacterized protein n=1 Tax=Dactylosporangium matsuzakiense TaxID=53360 RepID=A0A9W6KN68_9ACTN|nr:hypothetical protein GCM10017581_050190 [Dactylosporangium matsuzakiense]